MNGEPGSLATSPDSAPRSPLALAGARWAWPALLALALAGSFHEYLTWMAQQWWRDEYYGHGALIPLISGYLLYRRRAYLATLPREGGRWGLVLVACALLLHTAAQFFGIHFVSGFALVATLYGLVLWIGGRQVARALAFPVGFLLFMVPLSRLLVEKLALPMQALSARAAGAVSAAVISGTKVEGVSIITPDYAFSVAIPCSGLKSLIAMAALGALFAYLVEGTPVRRVLLFLCAFPLALLANLVRIFVTVVLGNGIGAAAAEGFFHSVSGAFVFLLALGGLFLVGGWLGCHKMRDDI